MRAKELKQFLNKLPDDTEILIRCQVHEHPAMGAKETVGVASITPLLSETRHQIMFNPEKIVRMASFQPLPTDMVCCTPLSTRPLQALLCFGRRERRQMLRYSECWIALTIVPSTIFP